MYNNFTIEFTNERIIPGGELAVVGAILGKSDFVKRMNRMDITPKCSQHQIKNGDILLTYVGMLCMGKPQYEAVHEMDDDPSFYKRALGVAYKIPSEETLRQRLDDISASIRSKILAENVEMLRSNGIHPSKIKEGFVPVDFDVSLFDNSRTHKEGVSRTYKGCDGYAPMLSYIGSEGYLINLQLREGSQHSQCGTPEYLRETIALCKQLTDENCFSDWIPAMMQPKTWAFSWRTGAFSTSSIIFAGKARTAGSSLQRNTVRM